MLEFLGFMVVVSLVCNYILFQRVNILMRIIAIRTSDKMMTEMIKRLEDQKRGV